VVAAWTGMPPTLQPALICRRGPRRSLTCGLRAGECRARLRLSGSSRRVDLAPAVPVP
jgi:hypothetical protein